MKILISRLLFFILVTIVSVHAQQDVLLKHEKKVQEQEKKLEKLKHGWNLSLASSLALTQTGYSNWESGGTNFFLVTGSVYGSAVFDTTAWNWANDAKIVYGSSRQNGDRFKKTDDSIDLETVFIHKNSELINPYISANFTTQLSAGYKYSEEGQTEISNFFDPAYLTNGVGIGYSPQKIFRTRLGLATRIIFTQEHNNFADGETTKFESGLQWVTRLEKQLHKNILLKSKLQMFSSFETIQKSNINWDTLIQASLTKFIVVNMQGLLILDPKVSEKAQIKEVLSVGVQYVFI